MTRRRRAIAALVGSTCLVCSAVVAARGQSPPQTPDGRPDLSGLWSFVSATPLQRPEEFGDKAVLGDEDLAALQTQAAQSAGDRQPPPGDTGSYNRFWTDVGAARTDRRTSLISDPPDGRLPPVTPAARERMRELMTAEANPEEPEHLTPWARCITGFNAGPPILPSGYNNNVLVVQNLDTVALLTEMVHEVRVVPLDGRRGLEPHVRQWQGVSRGRWEDDTLVIDTTNFRMDGNGSLPLLGVGIGGKPRSGVLTDENLHVVERLSLPETNLLRYEVRVQDPTVWTEPWTAVVFMRRSDEGIYEYACHEGNYGMANILAGARGTK